MLLVLGACGKREPALKAAEQSAPALDIVAADEMAMPAAIAPPPAGIRVFQPQIAYTYRYGFLIPAGALEGTQKAHLAACDRMGKARCQIIDMSRSGRDEEETGDLHLKVDATQARAFGSGLQKAVAGKGGELNESAVSAEDLSRQIVDTDARVKAKTLLAARLTELLATRKGTTGDLVTAERALSDVLEELDSARSQLADMKGRVVMSDINISYAARQTTAGSFADPLKHAVATVGETLGGSIAALLWFVIMVLPWLLAAWGGVKLYHKLGGRFPRLRWPWRRSAADLP